MSATAAALALPPAPRRAALLGLGSPAQVGAAVALLAAACAIALQVNSYYVFVLANVALLAIAGIGLNVLLGLTGQVSLGHVGFYAIGAYTVALLTTRLQLSFWLAWPLAAVLAGAIGGLLALPALRARGPYLAMITIAFGFVVENGIVEWRSLTGGQNGIMGVSAPALGGLAKGERAMALIAILGAASPSPAMPGSRAAPGARRCARCATRRPRPKRSASTRWRSSAWPSRSRRCAPARLVASSRRSPASSRRTPSASCSRSCSCSWS